MIRGPECLQNNTDIVVLFPFRLPIPVPQWLRTAVIRGMRSLRITAERSHDDTSTFERRNDQQIRKFPLLGVDWVVLKFPMDFVTVS